MAEQKEMFCKGSFWIYRTKLNYTYNYTVDSMVWKYSQAKGWAEIHQSVIPKKKRYRVIISPQTEDNDRYPGRRFRITTIFFRKFETITIFVCIFLLDTVTIKSCRAIRSRFETYGRSQFVFFFCVFRLQQVKP